MRLTYAALASAIKYPWCSTPSVQGLRPKSDKYGVFQTEVPHCHEIVRHTGLLPKGDNWYCRHPIVYLMEAAADFCHGIWDLEDCLQMGILTWPEIYDIGSAVVDPTALPGWR